MIDLLFAGWRAAQLWNQWNEKPANAKAGSAEEVRELREFTEALYEDVQRLIELTQGQEEKIIRLKRALVATCLVGVILLGLVTWAECSYFQDLARASVAPVVDLTSKMQQPKL